MGFAFAYSVQGDAHVKLVDEAADGLGLRETDAEACKVDEVFAVDVVEIPGGFPDASEYDEYRSECGELEVREIALLQVAVNSCLSRIESCGESGESVVGVKRNLPAVACLVKEIDESCECGRKVVVRVEDLFTPDLAVIVVLFAVVKVKVHFSLERQVVRVAT